MEKFSNKDYHGVSWAKTTEDSTSQIANSDREGQKRQGKCRGRDLNPRTPKGKDFPLPWSWVLLGWPGFDTSATRDLSTEYINWNCRFSNFNRLSSFSIYKFFWYCRHCIEKFILKSKVLLSLFSQWFKISHAVCIECVWLILFWHSKHCSGKVFLLMCKKF